MSLRLQLSEYLGYFPGLRLAPYPGYRPTDGGEPVAPVSAARPGEAWRLTRATGADRSPGKRSATGGLLAFAAQKIVNFATPIIGI